MFEDSKDWFPRLTGRNCLQAHVETAVSPPEDLRERMKMAVLSNRLFKVDKIGM